MSGEFCLLNEEKAWQAPGHYVDCISVGIHSRTFFNQGMGLLEVKSKVEDNNSAVTWASVASVRYGSMNVCRGPWNSYD